MSIQNWSENILVAELQDDPQFTDDIESLFSMVQDKTDRDAVLSFSAVTTLNSSNIAKLLKLRKQIVISNGRQLRLCAIDTPLWGVFLVTGLDKVFDFADNLANGLAAVQIENHQA